MSEIILCVDLSYEIDDTYNLDGLYELKETDSFENFLIYLFNITETSEGLYIEETDNLNLNVSSAIAISGEITSQDTLIIKISEENACILEIGNIIDGLNLNVSCQEMFEANTSGTDPPIINVEYKDYDEEIYCDENHQLDDEYVFNDKFEFDSLFNYIFNIHTSSLNIYVLNEDINNINIIETPNILSNIIPLSDEELTIKVNEVGIINIVSNDVLKLDVSVLSSLQNDVSNQDDLFIDVTKTSNIETDINSSDVLDLQYNSEIFIAFTSNENLNITVSEHTNILSNFISNDILDFSIFKIHDKTSILLYKLTYEDLKNAQNNCWNEELVCDSQLLINENYMLEEDDRFEILFSHLLLSPWKNVWEQYVKVNGKWKRIKINGIYQKVQGEWETSI